MVEKSGTRAPVGPRGSSKITVSRQDPVTDWYNAASAACSESFQTTHVSYHLNPGFARIEAVGHRVDSQRRQSRILHQRQRKAADKLTMRTESYSLVRFIREMLGGRCWP